jgi:hypothetical protein
LGIRCADKFKATRKISGIEDSSPQGGETVHVIESRLSQWVIMVMASIAHQKPRGH